MSTSTYRSLREKFDAAIQVVSKIQITGYVISNTGKKYPVDRQLVFSEARLSRLENVIFVHDYNGGVVGGHNLSTGQVWGEGENIPPLLVENVKRILDTPVERNIPGKNV